MSRTNPLCSICPANWFCNPDFSEEVKTLQRENYGLRTDLSNNKERMIEKGLTVCASVLATGERNE